MRGRKLSRRDEEDAMAVHERTLDLLVKYGLLDHGKGGISRSTEFAKLWISHIERAPTKHEALANAIRERTGGAESKYAMISMMRLYCWTFRGTSIGDTLDREEEEMARSGRGAELRRQLRGEGMRRLVRRTREDMESSRL